MTSSATSAETSELYKLFERCNRSELYQIARANGHHVRPNFTRDALIRSIIEEETPLPALHHEIDAWRKALMEFIIDHRAVLATQLTCPAKSFDPDACSGCLDIQVVSCLHNNGPENFRLISLKRKKPTNE